MPRTTNAAFGAHSRLIATLPTLRDELSPPHSIPQCFACLLPCLLARRAHRRDGSGAGHWENVWVSAAHPASNTYLVRRVPKDEPGDFLEAGEDASREPTMGARSHAGHERNDGEEEDESWRSEPLPPPPPPSTPGAFLPVDERSNLYGGIKGSGVVGVLRPPRDEWAVEPNSRGDGRGGLERAPWEEPLSEMVLARRRGAWVHRCRLQFRGEPAAGFIKRLQHAHDEMSAAHRGLALQLAADCMPAGDAISGGAISKIRISELPTEIRISELPTEMADRLNRQVMAWQAAPEYVLQVAPEATQAGDKARHWVVQRPSARSHAASRWALLEEVALDFSAVMNRLQLAHTVRRTCSG